MKTKLSLVFGGMLGAALLAIAASGSSVLDKYVSKVNSADGLTASYTVSVVGGDSYKVDVALAKPNKARIETAAEVIVADGKDIVRYDKKSNSYYRSAQTDADFRALFADQAASLWLPFYDKKSFDGMKSVKDGGSKNRKGKVYDVVNASYDAKGDITATLYVDQADGLAKQAEFNMKTAQGASTAVVNVTDLKLGANPNDLYVFSAPNGATELKMEDMALGTWLHDYDKGLEIAAKTKKMMMLDFTAVWCGPCQMMDREVFRSEEFKQLTKDVVLVKIDIDEQPGLASKYGVSSIPNVKFLKSSGEQFDEMVGYGGFRPTLDKVKSAKSNFK